MARTAQRRRQSTSQRTRNAASPSPRSARSAGRTRVERPRSARSRRMGLAPAGRPGHGAASPGSQADPSVVALLERFTACLTAGDGAGAAHCFEYPSLMVMSGVGPYGGSQPLSDAASVASFFAQAPQQYHVKGVYDTFPDIEEVTPVAADLRLVRVRFPYLDRDGNDLGDGETSLYLVRTEPEAPHICAVITLGTDGDLAAGR